MTSPVQDSVLFSRLYTVGVIGSSPENQNLWLITPNLTVPDGLKHTTTWKGSTGKRLEKGGH